MVTSSDDARGSPTTEHSWLEILSKERCLQLLRQESIGRIAIVIDGSPMILPVNYRMVEPPGRTWFALRTRPGNVVTEASPMVALEIDGIDPGHHEGWSVVARGTLHKVDADAAAFRERFDPEPWIIAERDAWMIIDPFAITGRQLHAAERQWAFAVDAYL
jgi:hypothetical protein